MLVGGLLLRARLASPPLAGERYSRQGGFITYCRTVPGSLYLVHVCPLHATTYVCATPSTLLRVVLYGRDGGG